MKRWVSVIIIVVIALLLLGIIGYLQSNGTIKSFGWQGLSMIFAGLAAPIKLLMNTLSDKDNPAQQIIDKQSQRKDQEKVHRQDMDKQILDRKHRIDLLDKEIEALDARLKLLKEKQKSVSPEIDQMNDKQKRDEARELWGS